MKNFIAKTLALSLIFIGGCDNQKEQKESTTLKSSSNCIITVGITPDQVPFAFIKDGQFLGFEIDLTNEIGKKLDCQIDFQDLPFYSLIQSLEGDKITLAIAGLAQTNERSKVVSFSKPYYRNAFSLLLKKQDFDPQNPITEGMKVGVQAGTAMQEWLQNDNVKTEPIVMDRILELVEELQSDRIDALLLDDVNAKFLHKEHEELFNLPLKQSKATDMAIALKKNNPLVNKVNEALDSLETDGTMAKLKQKWGL